MFHRRVPRHSAPPAPGWLARILHRASMLTAAPSGCVPGVEPVGPLPAGSMRQRPGGVYDQVLLEPSRPIGTALDPYRAGLDVVTTDDAEGIPAGMLGRVSLVAVWRTDRPIGVRMQAEGWSPLVWFNPGEVVSPIAAALALADTLVMDALEPADTLTMDAVADDDTYCYGPFVAVRGAVEPPERTLEEKLEYAAACAASGNPLHPWELELLGLDAGTDVLLMGGAL